MEFLYLNRKYFVFLWNNARQSWHVTILARDISIWFSDNISIAWLFFSFLLVELLLFPKLITIFFKWSVTVQGWDTPGWGLSLPWIFVTIRRRCGSAATVTVHHHYASSEACLSVGTCMPFIWVFSSTKKKNVSNFGWTFNPCLSIGCCYQLDFEPRLSIGCFGLSVWFARFAHGLVTC